MYQADGTIIKKCRRIRLLRQEGEQGLVELLETAPIHGEELVESITQVFLEGAPTGS